MKTQIIIIDIMRENSFYRLQSALQGYKNAIVLIPVHVLKNIQKIKNIFCISSLARMREGYLYPNQMNCFLARELPKRYSPKTNQTISIAVNMWLKNNTRVTVITDSKDVEKGIKMQNLDSDLRIIRL